VEIANAHSRGALVEAETVQREWCDVLRGVRAGMLALPSRCSARLPHLSVHDAAEIDAEVLAALTALGEGEAPL
jgi:terminase small subunit / prophage DNA-packing protein